MKKAAILTFSITLGLTGTAYAQFDVDIGDGPAAIAGQGVESSVVGYIDSESPEFQQNVEIVNGGELQPGQTGGVIGFGGGAPGGVVTIGCGSGEDCGLTTTTSWQPTSNSASLSATAGTNGGENVLENETGFSQSFAQPAFATARVTIEEEEDGYDDDIVTELVASAAGNTYATLDLDTVNHGHAFGLADVDVQQTGVAAMDVTAFDYQQNDFDFGGLW